MKSYYMCMKLPDDLRFRCEQYSHFQLDHINIYIYDYLPLPVNGEAFSERNNIHTTTLKREVIMHEIGHMIMKMNGNQPKGKKIHRIRIENNPKREQQADSIAKRMWEMPSIPYLGDYKVQNECNGVIEGNVGLEFQTVGKTWNVKKLKKNGLIYEFDGDLGHGGDLTTYKGVFVKTDFSDLEYVTPAVLELNPIDKKINTAERKKLVDYATEAGNFHKRLKEKKAPQGFLLANVPMKSKSKELLIDKALGNDNLTAINPNGTQKAHPQATVGVEFASIPKLISKMRTGVANSYLLGATNSTVNKELQQKTFQSVSGKLAMMSTLSNAGKGLVGLIQLNVMQFQEKSGIGYKESNLPANDKTALPLMQRTSFLSYYNKLTAADQNIVKVGLQDYHGGNTNFFGLDIKDTDLIAGQSNDSGEKTITFKDWCASFLAAIGGTSTATAGDLLESTADFNAVSKLYVGSPDLAGYGITTPTDIGDTREGVLMELRALKRGVEPDKWGYVAGVVFDLTCELNNVLPKNQAVLNKAVNTSIKPKIVTPKVPNTMKPFLTGAGSPLYK